MWSQLLTGLRNTTPQKCNPLQYRVDQCNTSTKQAKHAHDINLVIHVVLFPFAVVKFVCVLINKRYLLVSLFVQKIHTVYLFDPVRQRISALTKIKQRVTRLGTLQ